MSEKQKHIKSYSAVDIRNYLEGKLSSAEMYAMEKAAMDDPLLSDAMEGMARNNLRQNISFESDMDELKKRLQERITPPEKNRILPFILKWRVAASVMLLAGAGILSYFFMIRKPDTGITISLIHEKNKIADTLVQHDHIPGRAVTVDTVSQMDRSEVPKRTTDSVSPAFNDPSIPNRSVSNGERVAEKKKSGYEPEESRLSPPKAVPQTESAPVASIKPKGFSAPIPVDKNKADSHPFAELQGKAAGIAIPERGDHEELRRAAFNNQDKKSGNFYLQGTVTDSNGIPIADATVMLMHTKEAVSTDINGMFRLKIVFPDSSQDIVVNSIGYQPVSFAINPAENKDKLIRLPSAGNSLADVVVTAYGIQKRDVTEEEEIASPVQKKPTTEKAAPVNGWPGYNAYINKNKKIIAPDSRLKGIEIVSFLINRKGELSSFKIEKSLSPAHDAAVIRLIKEGPAWKLFRGKRHRCRITVEFN